MALVTLGRGKHVVLNSPIKNVGCNSKGGPLTHGQVVVAS